MAVIALELPDDQAARPQAQAWERGLTVGEWVAELSGQVPAESSPMAEDQPVWEVLADSLKDLPAEDRALLPRDGASQVDHYVYGLPKREP